MGRCPRWGGPELCITLSYRSRCFKNGLKNQEEHASHRARPLTLPQADLLYQCELKIVLWHKIDWFHAAIYTFSFCLLASLTTSH